MVKWVVVSCGSSSDHPPQADQFERFFFSLRILISLLNNSNNIVKTAVKCLSIWFYYIEIDGEIRVREGSLQGIEPPVRGSRPKTDQRLVGAAQPAVAATAATV